MSTHVSRSLALALAVTLVSAGLASAQSNQDDQGRSYNAQSENQTTRDFEQLGDQQTRQPEGQDAQYQRDRQDDREGVLERNDDRQSRRGERQDQRQVRRQDDAQSGDRQPAIGVTVVERGGIGVRVMGVVPDSPAAQAGIEPGDTILEVEGRRASSAQQLVSLIQDQQAGDTVEFAVIREGREYQVPVRLSTREEALPARLRGQGGEQDQGRRFSQDDQRWQQDQNQQARQQGQQRWQQGQYDQQRQYAQDEYQQQYGQQQDQRDQYGQRQSQWDQGQRSDDRNQYQRSQAGYEPPQTPSPYTGAYRQDDSSNRQASYGEPGNDRQFGERLAQRLSQFEQRLERITQRLEQVERDGGLRFQAGSDDSRQSGSYRDEDHDDSDDENEDEKQ